MSRYNDNDEKFKSIRSNTISEQLYTDLREDYGFPPAVCRSLAENFLDIMDLYYGGERHRPRNKFRGRSFRFVIRSRKLNSGCLGGDAGTSIEG